MAGGLGVLGYIGFAPEASGGVAVDPQAYLPALSEGVSGDYDRYALYNIIGRLAPPDDRAGIMRVAGDILAPLDPIVDGHRLKSGFGNAIQVTSGPGGTGLWMHVWKSPTQSFWDDRYALPPYTLEVFRDVVEAQQYDGVNTNEMEFTLEPNGVLRLRSGIIGTAWRNKAANVASYQQGYQPFDFDTCSFQIGGAPNFDVEAFGVTWSNNLEGIATLSGRDTVRKIRRSGPPTMELSMTIGFENTTHLEAFRQQSETAIGFTLTTNSLHQFSLVLPRVVYSAVPTGMGGGGRQTLEITGMARYHQGSGTAFDARLINSVGSY